MSGEEPGRKREESWARPVSELHISHELPPEAVNINLEGKRPAPLAGGFGRLWQKTYRVRIPGDVTPEEVIKTWKEKFPSFWSKGMSFYGPLANISPGDVALLNLTLPGRVKLSTGILVLYADDVSFSFMNPEGHFFAGMVTFSAQHEEDATVAQVQGLIRASDPINELMCAVFAYRQEDRHWKATLESLARHFGAEAEATMSSALIDKKRQWRQWKNVFKNAGIRSVLYALTTPLRAVARLVRRDRA